MNHDDILPSFPDYPVDPLRDRVLMTLANSDMQRWTDLTTYRHMAEMMYGQQADAVIELFTQLTEEGNL